MSEEFSDNVAKLLKQKLAQQDELKSVFDAASPADSYKDDIDLDDKYKSETEFRMDRFYFIIKHVPTELLNRWPAMTGPRALKRGIESWVDDIEKTYPSSV